MIKSAGKEYNKQKSVALEYKKLDLKGVLSKARSCGVFHVDMGVYIQNTSLKPRAPQKNNRYEVKDVELADAFPGAKCVRLMTDEQLKKWGPMIPTDFTKHIMSDMKSLNPVIYHHLNTFWWNVKLQATVHYLFGWIRNKLTHDYISVS